MAITGWTAERRQEASERAKLRWESRRQENSMEPQVQEIGPIDVETSQVEPSRASTAMKISSELRRQSYVEENFVGEDGVVNMDGHRFGGAGSGVMVRAVQHKRSKRIRLYKPYATCVMAVIPAEAFDQSMDDGWMTECPECGTDCGSKEWGCAKKPEPKYMRCEVCNRKFHESPPVVSSVPLEKDPLRMENPWKKTDDLGEVTSMTASANYLAHMWGYHRQTALAMGLPVPEPQ